MLLKKVGKGVNDKMEQIKGIYMNKEQRVEQRNHI